MPRHPGRTADPPENHQPHRVALSTSKLRPKVTRGAGSPTAALAMVFKLVESA
ncbi:hypothetical protein ACIA78_25395 [Streptomyces xanthochromogenes]|uniref:hypothetical protein n=1 Tax=Streptomyces xanthochromogenes TaxID=67384 RepID=UPI003787C8BF